jgi:hypothetical protein
MTPCPRPSCRGTLLHWDGEVRCHLYGRVPITNAVFVQPSLFKETSSPRRGRPPGRGSEWRSLRGSR